MYKIHHEEFDWSPKELLAIANIKDVKDSIAIHSYKKFMLRSYYLADG